MVFFRDQAPIRNGSSRTPPRIPPEIWRLVFRTVIGDDEDALNPRPVFPTPYEARNPDINRQFEVYNLQLSVKRRLVLVSKHWRNMTCDMLYECVRIRSLVKLHAMLQFLEDNSKHVRSPDDASKPGLQPYGWYIRHLHITFHHVKQPSPRLQKNIQTTCYSVLKHCNNLRDLELVWNQDPRGLPVALTSEILHNHNHSMQYLRLREYRCASLLNLELGRLDNVGVLILQTHSIVRTDTIDDGVTFDLSGIYLPSLHTLEVRGLERFVSLVLDKMSRSRLPSIRNVCLTTEPINPSSFFDIHGPSLLTLALQALPDDGHSPDLSSIIPRCTNLQHLTIDSCSSIHVSGEPPLEVTTIGINRPFTSWSIGVHSFPSFEATLSAIERAKAPSLKRIRLLHSTKLAFETEYGRWELPDGPSQTWRDSMKRLHDRQVQFEDATGLALDTLVIERPEWIQASPEEEVVVIEDIVEDISELYDIDSGISSDGEE
jgi:hypothetical protein